MRACPSCQRDFRLEAYGAATRAVAAVDVVGAALGTYLHAGGLLDPRLDIRDETSAPTARLEPAPRGFHVVETGGDVIAHASQIDVEDEGWVDDQWTLTPTTPRLPMRPLALVVLVLLLASACSGSGADDDAGGASTTIAAAAPSTTTAPPSTTSTTSTACTADDADPSGLEPLLVDEVDGFQLQPSSVGNTGPSDLGKAIADDGSADARQVLTDLRFRRGYQRLWRNEFREEVVLFVYEFCGDDGPPAYASRTAALVASNGAAPQPFATDPPLTGFSIDAEDVVAAFVSAPAGPRLVHVIAYARSDTSVVTVQARATALATEQLALL